MPHDKNGKVIQAGDEVLVRCRVRDVSTGEEFCNATLETVEPMYPGDSKTTIVVNAKQVEKVETTSDQADGAAQEPKAEEEQTGAPV